jgi:hypothetical protein
MREEAVEEELLEGAVAAVAGIAVLGLLGKPQSS